MSVFQPFDVLLPSRGVSVSWPVIACDQFTSEPEYWEKVCRIVGTDASTLALIFPEVWLGKDNASRIGAIEATMRSYLKNAVLASHPASFVYVERTLCTGAIRRGVVGTVDLEAYDFSEKTDKPIRATEKTVRSRIPPRVAIRKDASLELSHVLLLADDPTDRLLSGLEQKKATLPKLYDLDLMLGGGNLVGYLVSGNDAAEFSQAVADYEKERASVGTLFYCVGDGNHSLATAKTCYEDLKTRLPSEEGQDHPARYAMVELGNIRDKSLAFEPIHRLIVGKNPETVLSQLAKTAGALEGHRITWVAGQKTGEIILDRKFGVLPVAALQSALDDCLPEVGAELDYIHGEASLRKLAQEDNRLGFLLTAIAKEDFFTGVALGGVFPRKTFSMGEATDKRYYTEARRIVR
jgi:hypothetical protein